jgi:hypothetical protein
MVLSHMHTTSGTAGLEYQHDDLGGGFGPSFKVAKGYDFVGDNGFMPGALLATRHVLTSYHLL